MNSKLKINKFQEIQKGLSFGWQICLLLIMQNYDKIVSISKKYISSERAFESIYHFPYAYALEKIGRYQDALYQIQLLKNNNEENYYYNYLEIKCLYRCEHYQDCYSAAILFVKIKTIDFIHRKCKINIYWYIGISANYLQKYDDTIKYMKLYLENKKRDKNIYTAYECLGYVYLKKNCYQKAEQYFTMALSKNPDSNYSKESLLEIKNIIEK